MLMSYSHVDENSSHALCMMIKAKATRAGSFNVQFDSYSLKILYQHSFILISLYFGMQNILNSPAGKKKKKVSIFVA